MDSFGLVDISPSVIVPTWSNRRVGIDNISKRLDRLFISADLLDLDLHFRQWVGCGGDSDHQPVFLQILNRGIHMRSPFKFNAHWLVNDDLVKLLKESWVLYSDNLHVSLASHFASNIKRIKDVSISWSVLKKEVEFKYFVEIEILLTVFSHKINFGFSSEEDKASLIDLESRKRKILLDCEHEARQKTRAIWLLCGDDNTPFFQKFANQRKNVNSIWKIKDDRGSMVEGFDAIAGAGVQHFETLF